jgi:hypothetical protein
MSETNWVERLKKRWNLTSAWQVVLVLIVFACTGTTVLLIKKPLFAYWFPDGDKPLWASLSYWVLIFPVYNVFLLIYGFIFGQFKFFWEFEKKFFAKMAKRFGSRS